MNLEETMGRRWWVPFWVVCMIGILGGAPRFPSPQTLPPGRYVPDELLVKFAPGADPTALAHAFGFRLHYLTRLGVASSCRFYYHPFRP